MSFLSGVGSALGTVIGGAYGGPAGASIGGAVGGGLGNAVGGMTSGLQGNIGGNLATAGNTDKQQKLYEYARANNISPQELASHAQNMANADQENLFQMGQKGAAFQNQLQQDIERGRTYNTLATQGQNLAAQNAQTLAQAYAQARNANAQLLQGAIGSMGVR